MYNQFAMRFLCFRYSLFAKLYFPFYLHADTPVHETPPQKKRRTTRYGCVADMDVLLMTPYIFDVDDGIQFTELAGSKPFLGAIRNVALRTGPMALGGVSVQQLFGAMNKSMLVSWLPVPMISDQGITLEGATIEKPSKPVKAKPFGIAVSSLCFSLVSWSSFPSDSGRD